MNMISLSYNVVRPRALFSSNFSAKRATRAAAAVSAAAGAGRNPKKRFAEEMKMAAMKLHKPAEKEAASAGFAIAKWEPSLEGYLKFLVNSKLIYEALERIVDTAVFPECE